ncbi:MAG: UDP-GlcNAc transferase associated protein Alg14 [Amphiamblys sp. WSBS2006]|nr:MAG: UDP-GlcNAc transferase associated protein Alg14 [Amphiamblys sp. WSBS2006]
MKQRRVLCVLGGGGHSREMLSMARSLTPLDVFYLGCEGLLLPRPAVCVPLVLQERCFLLRTIGLLRCGWDISLLFLSGGMEWPDVVLCNGPGIAVVVVGVFYLFSFFRKRPRLVFVETAARTRTFSRSGALVYFLCDVFVAQWRPLGRGCRSCLLV